VCGSKEKQVKFSGTSEFGVSEVSGERSGHSRGENPKSEVDKGKSEFPEGAKNRGLLRGHKVVREFQTPDTRKPEIKRR
jgi:hypothetical protein